MKRLLTAAAGLALVVALAGSASAHANYGYDRQVNGPHFPAFYYG